MATQASILTHGFGWSLVRILRIILIVTLVLGSGTWAAGAFAIEIAKQTDTYRRGVTLQAGSSLPASY